MAQTVSGAVIHMSLLTDLTLPESIVTEGLLLQLSLLPRLEALTISPAPPANDLSGRVPRGFAPLRALEIPNGNLLRWFASHPLLGLDSLKVAGLDGKALIVIARKFPNLRQISIEGASFGARDLLVMGACFQLEDIKITTQDPLGMDDVDLDRFRSMFRNLRDLSVVVRDH